MTRVLETIVVILLAATCAPQTLVAQKPGFVRYLVEGRVTDWVTGEGIAAATVAATDANTKSYSTLTAADGSYRLEHLPRTGELKLTCSQLGYRPNPTQTVMELKPGVSNWDTRLFKEHGSVDYLAAAVMNLSALNGPDRLAQARFVAENVDPNSKKIITVEIQEGIRAGMLNASIAEIAPIFATGTSEPDSSLKPGAQQAATNPAPTAQERAIGSAQAAAPVSIPAGTLIAIRTVDAIDSRKVSPGQTYHANLDEPIVVGADTLAPKGAEAILKLIESKSAGRLTGRAEVKLSLASIKIGDRMVDVNTENLTSSSDGKGKGTATKAGIGAATGAVVGGIFAGGLGAVAGAAAGGAAGTGISMILKGPRVTIPPETRLSFKVQ